MQNKGAVKVFAIAFALVCVYQLSFTYFTKKIERDAKDYAYNQEAAKIAKYYAKGSIVEEKVLLDSIAKARENHYLDSIGNESVYNFLWIKKYTYKECKEREINLGLDLKGGMNVTLEVSVVDIIRALSNNSQDPTFNKAIDLANQMHKNSQEDYVTLFGKAFETVAPGEKLAAIFNTLELKDKVKYNSTNEEVLAVIKKESDDAIDRTFNILRTRIDRFGVAQPNIQRLQTAGRILVELPGIKDPARVRKILQGTAKLEFWETFENKEIYPFLEETNKKLRSIYSTTDSLAILNNDSLKDTTKNKITSAVDTTKKGTLLEQIKKDTSKSETAGENKTFEDYIKNNPLFGYLRPNLYQREGKYEIGEGPVVGYVAIKDTAKVDRILEIEQIKNIFPRNLKLLWVNKPSEHAPGALQLIAIKITSRDKTAPLGGDAVTDARQDFGQNNTSEISMSMNSEGAKTWKRLTANNIGKCIAIVLDNYVYSFPVVHTEIPNGRSSITGNFTLNEAKDLANILKTGKLPAPAKIVEEAIVGPTLGKESINSGLWSFIVAFLLTLLYMIFYYSRAGLVANVALFANMFFVFGILASLGAVLTLPGIAGIVLTIGMDVDKNVIIYERVREEIRAGKGIRLAISDGYKHAYSAIIDSNITLLLTGIVLYIFGSGSVQGFATTLIIGIISSLFCAIFITRLLFIWMMDKNKEITVWNKFSKNILTNVNIDFIGVRKTFYFISGALVVIGIISLSTRGLEEGIDFTGGRTYVVRFDKDVRTDNIRAALKKVFNDKAPEVKTFGANSQVKITTSYMIDEKSSKSDSVVETKLYEGLKPFYLNKISKEVFLAHSENKVLGKLSSQRVEPTIAYRLKRQAILAVFFSLVIIFIYIAFRFKKWQWGLGGVVSLFHDSFIVISVFSLLHGVLPFTLEIDQHFIAAILTIIGYSIMDSVIIFDRIREYNILYPKRDIKTNMNDAMNSTLGRTLNTSGITFMVLLAMFIFGGEVIRGFAFALMLGVFVGTYSSILNATPIAYDLIIRKKQKELIDKE